MHFKTSITPIVLKALHFYKMSKSSLPNNGAKTLPHNSKIKTGKPQIKRLACFGDDGDDSDDVYGIRWQGYIGNSVTTVTIVTDKQNDTGGLRLQKTKIMILRKM